jgi:hypothetical protein
MESRRSRQVALARLGREAGSSRTPEQVPTALKSLFNRRFSTFSSATNLISACSDPGGRKSPDPPRFERVVMDSPMPTGGLLTRLRNHPAHSYDGMLDRNSFPTEQTKLRPLRTQERCSTSAIRQRADGICSGTNS